MKVSCITCYFPKGIETEGIEYFPSILEKIQFRPRPHYPLARKTRKCTFVQQCLPGLIRSQDNFMSVSTLNEITRSWSFDLLASDKSHLTSWLMYTVPIYTFKQKLKQCVVFPPMTGTSFPVTQFATHVKHVGGLQFSLSQYATWYRPTQNCLLHKKRKPQQSETKEKGRL